jgi:hypothetical protein
MPCSLSLGAAKLLRISAWGEGDAATVRVWLCAESLAAELLEDELEPEFPQAARVVAASAARPVPMKFLLVSMRGSFLLEEMMRVVVGVLPRSATRSC